MNYLAKAALVCTSFSPVLLTYAFVLWLRKAPTARIAALILIVAALIALCLLIMRTAKQRLETIAFPIQTVKTADGEVLAFLLAYLFPFTSLSTDVINETMLLFALVIILLVIWGTQSFHVNPILTLLGYHFYEVSTEGGITYLLISKRTLRNVKSINTIVHLTDYMVLDAEEEG
ncbi:hypothetical protein [Paenibacillus thermotolerans]|uniref:hypothetical protein n=1 Tax=Paenibacillus thermotolerans TaxID=3027807 RepID=UPI002368DE1C|nr:MULTISPECIES: hypothetical protein [unclassified Paenibacillus]